MRVLATTPNYLPSRVGAWLATHRLLVRLVQRGHDVTVFCWERREPDRDVDGVTVVSGLRGRSHGFDLADKCDVVLSHFGDKGVTSPEPSGPDYARAAGKPSIRLAHGGGPYGPDGCDLAVFNSHSLRDAWRWRGPSIVVHPYTDPAEHRTKPGDRVTLVNLAVEKGGELFERLCRSMPHISFLGVRGGYGTQIVPRYGNAETIQPTPHMRDDVWSRTRLLLMPSQYETWGMVGVEALASGIPVIAHPTPGLKESLGPAGIFVDRDDSHGWVDAIERLRHPAAWKKASAKARKRSAELAAVDDRDAFAEAVEAFA